MTIFGWVCVGLLVAYWVWTLTSGTRITSWIFPTVISVVLGGLAAWSFMAPPPAPPPLLGGLRKFFRR